MTSTMNSTVVNLFISFAALLSGDPADCPDPTDVNDESCSGGLASVASHIRHSRLRGEGPGVHLPYLDRMSKFVQMHPNGWGVNKLVSHDRFGWSAFFGRPSLFAEDENRGASLLQTHGFVPLITNLVIPLVSPWYWYLENIHLDYETSTAYIQITTENQPFSAPAVESLVASLDYVAHLNEISGCFGSVGPDKGFAEAEDDTVYSRCTAPMSCCWLAIVAFSAPEQGLYDECLEAALNHPHPPLIFYDVDSPLKKNTSAVVINNTLVHHPSESTVMLSHLCVEVGPYDTSKSRPITHMTFSEVDLKNLPLEFKDDMYVEDQRYLRELADEALSNDPIVGESGYMPFTRLGDLRMCMGGECPLGNLFTDALRWAGEADFAVLSSGGLRGPGWDEGPVRISDIWTALPFGNLLCTGVMSGVSVYRLLNYSTAVSTFESAYTAMGDRLLQVSGMKYTYNTLLNGTERLISVEMWDESAQEYFPLERTKMYRFATDSYNCDWAHPYPSLLGSDLTMDGEAPGVVDRNRNVQEIVSEFLGSRHDSYDTSVRGRLVNDTEAFDPLDFTPVLVGLVSDVPKQSMRDTIAYIVGPILLFVFVVLFVVNRRQSKIIKSQQSMIQQNELLMEQKDKEVTFCLGTSKFGDAVAFVDSLLIAAKPGNSLVGPDDVDDLILVKNCLLKGSNDNTMHVPKNLTGSDRDTYILKEFAGYEDEIHCSDKQPRRSTQNFLRLSPLSAEECHAEAMRGCLPEFTSLDAGKKEALFELLSFSNLAKWNFNIFDVSSIDEENTMLFVAWAIIGSPHSQFAMAREIQKTDAELGDFEGYNFFDTDFDIEMETLCNYLRVIQKDYNYTPYHNAIHAADVVQTINSMIQIAGDDLFQGKEIFAIILAGVVHDVKHPGLNNSFQVNSFSNLALNHNDVAVLENEHASHAFTLLVKGLPGKYSNLNFMRNLDISEFREFRQNVVSAVLHTDMSHHFSNVAKMKNLAVGKPWDEIECKLRWEILSFMLHLADISNPAKDDPMFKLWTDRCLEEFFLQGDKEREMGLPISPNCCRNQTKKPDSQIGFINFIVKPSYQVLGEIFPALGEAILPIIRNNRVFWEHQKLNENRNNGQ